MKKLPFKSSAIASLGVELEIQLINPHTYDMASGAKELLRKIQQSSFHKLIKPEITQSMIEINSSIHLSPQTLAEEFAAIKKYLLQEARVLDIAVCGGGTHPFQKWVLRKIFPTKRFKNLSRIYRYLSKQATVFGQHIHIGCGSGDEAIYLTHVLGRYVPHLIAMSASSPYYQGVDTGYYSSRPTLFNSFPMSGVIPFITNWQDFCAYFFKMKDCKIIHSMKDCYWDIRPKPEFGTVEIRVCDTPLTLNHAIIVCAYAQSLALYLLQERPYQVTQDQYYLYGYNRFQACRYGFHGKIIDPFTYERRSIGDDLLLSLEKVNKYANHLHNANYLQKLDEFIRQNYTDAAKLRKIMREVKSLPKVVAAACQMWEQDGDHE